MSKELDDVYVRKDIQDKDNEIIAAEINSLNARLDDIKSFISWSMALLGLIFVVAQIGIGYLLYLLTSTPH